MTRIKEVEPGSEDLPDYKSPAGRLVHSLRKGYNNLRGKLKETKDAIKYYQIKVRDLEKSRSQWKEGSKELESELKRLREENKALQKENEQLKESKKK